MSESLAGLRRKIDGATELKSVVRTMKALAASSIGQYEKAVLSLNDYYRTVQLGLVACLRQPRADDLLEEEGGADEGPTIAFVFGSDQGLVGPFNDILATFATATLTTRAGEKDVWAVGSRIEACLGSAGLPVTGVLTVPNSIPAITPLIGRILVEIGAHRRKKRLGQVYIFHHSPKSKAAYEPVSQRLLPLDAPWRTTLTGLPWPTRNLPEVLAGGEATLRAFLREYLFVSLFRACIESLTSENASRLAAMQRAEKNIDELLEDLNRAFHRLRQSTIDDELFDVISGYESLSTEKRAL
ncbi:MAG TPA: F0F1 ATP synthase subunit gamma [Bradyrhizobium sp.]|nr:F0F1 ATP synthase subunit gamma [Bradyrhizobium sp.]